MNFGSNNRQVLTCLILLCASLISPFLNPLFSQVDSQAVCAPLPELKYLKLGLLEDRNTVHTSYDQQKLRSVIEAYWAGTHNLNATDFKIIDNYFMIVNHREGQSVFLVSRGEAVGPSGPRTRSVAVSCNVAGKIVYLRSDAAFDLAFGDNCSNCRFQFSKEGVQDLVCGEPNYKDTWSDCVRLVHKQPTHGFPQMLIDSLWTEHNSFLPGKGVNAESGSLTIQVRAYDSGDPIENANITVINPVVGTVTNANGLAEIRIEGSQEEAVILDVQAVSHSPARIELYPDVSNEKISVFLWPEEGKASKRRSLKKSEVSGVER